MNFVVAALLLCRLGLSGTNDVPPDLFNLPLPEEGISEEGRPQREVRRLPPDIRQRMEVAESEVYWMLQVARTPPPCVTLILIHTSSPAHSHRPCTPKPHIRIKHASDLGPSLSSHEAPSFPI